jgi:hypothetical protein
VEVIMAEQQTKMISLNDLHTEPGSEMLVQSESMKPYLEVLKAEMTGRDTGPALAALEALPLEQRYVWRVISALKWGLCDLETENVAADIATLSEVDLRKVTEPLALRAMQFFLFAKALVGEAAAIETMRRALACQG